jgi:hypothetical protein
MMVSVPFIFPAVPFDPLLLASLMATVVSDACTVR